MSNIDRIANELTRLEKKARLLEPDHAIRKSWAEKVFQFGEDFLNNLDHSPVFEEKDSSRLFFERFLISEEGQVLPDVLEDLQKEVIDPGLNPASGGHLGYIPGGGLYPAALGDYLADITNKYAGIFFAGPGAVRLENYLVKWMASLFAYPSNAAGHLASGGSIANLTAIVTARDAKKISGMNIAKSAIYHTNQVHHCIDKAIRIAGLAEAPRRIVAMDQDYRMDTDDLQKLMEKDASNGIKPFLVVASVGSTDTGAIDPLENIAVLCKTYDSWFHVDAAYGGFFSLLDDYRMKFKGIEQSDSVVVDPHKGLFLPYGIGAVMVKDGEALHRSHQYQANYMQDAQAHADEWSPAELSPELTKHFRGLRMWLPLKLFGLEPFKSALKEKIFLARYFYEKLKEHPDFELGPYPDLSVVIYRYKKGSQENEKNLELADQIRKSGKVFISSTTIKGVVWLRLAVLSFRTHKATIDLLLEELREKAARL